MRIIYADELFLTNLVIDYFILIATARLCALPLKRLRFALSAAFGALYAALPLWPPMGFLASPLLKLLCGGCMVLIAFGSGRPFLRRYIAFFAVSAAFGGAVYAATLLSGSTVGFGILHPVSLKVLILSFAVSYFALTLVLKRTGRRIKRQTASAAVTLCGRSASFTVLKDTGNELYDPTGGLPVMVTDGDVASRLLPEAAARALKTDVYAFMSTISEDELLRCRFRLVPFSTVNGRALMPVFKPDSLIIDGRPSADILIGLVAGSLCEDREYSGIL